MTPVTFDPRVFQSSMSLKGTAEVVGDQLKFSVWWPRTLMLYPMFKTIKETFIPLNRIANVSRNGESILFDWIQDNGVSRRVEFHADGFDNAAQLASEMQAAIASHPVTTMTVASTAGWTDPEQQTFAAHLNAGTRVTWATYLFVGINIAVYVVMGLCGVNLLRPKPDEMIPWGANFWPLTTNGQWWRLLTCAFLHFGFLHIAFNMWALWAVGRFTERLYGSVTFAFIYLVSAVLASLLSVWWDAHNVVMAGASGAVFAVYGALMGYMTVHRKSMPSGVKSIRQSAMAFVFYNLVFGMMTPGISNSAHLGGLFSGLVLGAIVARPLNPEERYQRTGPTTFVGILVATLVIMVGIAIVPKNSGDMEAQKRFIEVWTQAETEETRLNTVFETLRQQAVANQLTDAEYATRLDRDFIPAFEKIVRDLDANQPGPGRLQKVSELMRQYYGLRLQAYQTLSEAAHTGNEAKMASYDQLIKQGDALLPAIEAEVKNLEKQ